MTIDLSAADLVDRTTRDQLREQADLAGRASVELVIERSPSQRLAPRPRSAS